LKLHISNEGATCRLSDNSHQRANAADAADRNRVELAPAAYWSGGGTGPASWKSGCSYPRRFLQRASTLFEAVSDAIPDRTIHFVRKRRRILFKEVASSHIGVRESRGIPLTLTATKIFRDEAVLRA
jgi:hypothetical protein